jgi:hypothetical protein
VFPGNFIINIYLRGKKKCDGKGKFGAAASCVMMAVMVVGRIAKASVTNEHRRAFKFSLILLKLFSSRRKVNTNILFFYNRSVKIFFFFCCYQKKKKQKEKSPLFENVLKYTDHLSHATTSHSLCSLYGSHTSATS